MEKKILFGTDVFLAFKASKKLMLEIRIMSYLFKVAAEQI